jgi:hypothetical protein
MQKETTGTRIRRLFPGSFGSAIVDAYRSDEEEQQSSTDDEKEFEEGLEEADEEQENNIEAVSDDDEAPLITLEALMELSEEEDAAVVDQNTSDTAVDGRAVLVSPFDVKETFVADSTQDMTDLGGEDMADLMMPCDVKEGDDPESKKRLKKIKKQQAIWLKRRTSRAKANWMKAAAAAPPGLNGLASFAYHFRPVAGFDYRLGRFQIYDVGDRAAAGIDEDEV